MEAFVKISVEVRIATLLESWRSPKRSSSDLPQGALASPASLGPHMTPIPAIHSVRMPNSWVCVPGVSTYRFMTFSVETL